jgi:vesicle coat complex subunit
MQAWTASASNAGTLSFFGAGSLLSRVGSDAAYIDEPEEKAIPPLLESRYQEEKIEGLKRTIALITLGKDVSEYFPQVNSYASLKEYRERQESHRNLVQLVFGVPGGGR